MQYSSGSRKGLLVWVTVGAACASGDADAVDTQEASSLDTAVLLNDLSFLAADSLEGRLVGSRGNGVARDFIVERFERLQLTNFEGSFTSQFPVERNGATLTGVNVVGYVEGNTDPNRFIVLTAHYDHLGVQNGEIYNGADDNGSGTAALLALAAYFAEHRPRNSILFAAVDAEEGGLAGARALVGAPPVELERIAANVNMDMISHSENEIYVAGTYHYPFMKPYVERVTQAEGLTLVFGHDSPDLGNDDWTNASDHAPFHAAGIPFLYFGVEDHPDYHRPTDVFDNINPDFYLLAANAILQVVLELDRDLESVMAKRGGQ